MIRQAYFEHPDYVPLLKRAYQLWQDVFRGRNRIEVLPYVWFPIFAQLISDAIGQMVGFLFGEGKAAQDMARHELIDRFTIS